MCGRVATWPERGFIFIILNSSCLPSRSPPPLREKLNASDEGAFGFLIPLDVLDSRSFLTLRNSEHTPPVEKQCRDMDLWLTQSPFSPRSTYCTCTLGTRTVMDHGAAIGIEQGPCRPHCPQALQLSAPTPASLAALTKLFPGPVQPRDAELALYQALVAHQRGE